MYNPSTLIPTKGGTMTYTAECEKCHQVFVGHGETEQKAKIDAETELCYHMLEKHGKDQNCKETK